jgi:endonuclease/exonuclease/phosphatase family metal-dependent hydrolase
VLARLDADVIAVQEVTRGAGRGDQAALLADALGMHLARCEVRPHGEGTYGHAVLSRLPLDGVTVCDLTVGRREPRRAMRVDVGGLHVFACHLGLGPGERRAQVERLVRFLREPDVRRGRRVVLGDLNEWWRGPVARTLRAELGDGTSMRDRTHPAPAPLFALDRVYWEPPVVGVTRVHRGAPAGIASDHLPIVVELRH